MSQVKVRHEQGKLRQELEIGRHRLVADVEAELGGEGSGPSPHDYLVAALGACTAITIRMYAQRKNWPLENAEVTVAFSKEGDASKFDLKLQLLGPLDQAQRERLLEIARHCPVHRILTGKIDVQSSLVEGA